jgi:hypothetical protein
MEMTRSITAGVLLMLLAAGCVMEQSEPLQMSTSMRLSDLPVPKGMKFDAQRSHERITPSRRAAYHAYTGNASVLAVIRFYRDQLPISNWKFINEQMDRGVTVLDYEKEDERLAVKVFRKEFKTQLILHLYEKD